MPCLAGVGSEAVSFSSILGRSSVGDLVGIGDLVGFGGMACVAFVGGPFAGALASSQAGTAGRPVIGGPRLAVRTKGLELVGAGGIAGGALYGSVRSSTCMVQVIGPSSSQNVVVLRGGGGFLTGGTFCVGTLTVPKLGTGGGPLVLPAPGGGLG